MGRGLDDTKNKLGVEMMDDSTKKELFKKFTDHGGQVIDDSTARRQQHTRQDKSAPRGVGTAGRGPASPQDLKAATLKKKAPKRDGIGTKLGIMMGRVKLYMRSIFQNVMDSSGTFLSPKFFDLLHNEATNKLLDLNLLLTPLVHAPNDLKGRLQAGLSRISSHYYELLIRMGNIYDEKLFRDVLFRFTQNSSSRITPKELADALKELYKRVYILRNYSQGCTVALTRGLEIQADIEEKEKVALRRNISRARKDLAFVFSSLLPKLHLAVCNVLKRNYAAGDRELEAFLELGEEDQVGYISDHLAREIRDAEQQHRKAIEETKEKIKEEAKEIRVDQLQESVQQGLDLMRRLPINKDRVIQNQDSPLRFLPQDSKSYLSQLLFREIEKEYVFLLTSNQIKYSIQYHDGIKIDMKQKLGDLSIEFDHIHAMIEEFNKTLLEKTGIERSTQSVTRKNQLMHNITIKYSKLAKQIRQRLAKFCGDVEREIRYIINDRSGNGQLLQNPDDEIVSDLNIGDPKKLEGETVLTCLTTVMNFCAALRYRLNDGDLSGLGETIDMLYDFGEAGEPTPPPEATEAP